MLTIVKEAESIINNYLHEIAEDVYNDMVATAPIYTGEVMRSIHVQRMGKYWYRIAPHTDHDYWAEEGNHANNSDGRIHPTKKQALAFTTKYGKNVVAKSVAPHEGSHFVRNIYNKYR